jgi:ABC-type branched-subunit amino acid transport system substrate-binding protein
MSFIPQPVWIPLVLLAGALILRAEPADPAIGLLLPPEEPESASLREGATLGVELANKALGVRYRLIIRGRTGPWGADGVEAARMATDDGALGLIAPPDGAASHLVLQVSGRTGVPVVSLCADSSVSRTGVPWAVRMVARTEDEATALFAHWPAARWTALIPGGRSGREIARDLRTAATTGQYTLGQIIEVLPSSTNAESPARQVVLDHPAAVLLWLDPIRAGQFVRALRAVGFTGTLAGPGRLRSPVFAAAAGSDLEGFVAPAPALDTDAADALQSFSDVFRARYGHEPDPTAEAAGDAATLLIHILRNSGEHPARETFPLSFSCGGTSGPLTFDAQGNRKMILQLFRAHQGHYIPITTEANH